MKIVYRLLFALHVFVGLVAMVGGPTAILNPQEPFGMSVELLEHSPFINYLIPGIMLFILIGIGNITCALAFHFKSRYQGYLSGVISCILVIWVIVQCIMLDAIAFRNVLFLVIGLIQVVLSMIILFEKRQFPTNIILYFYKKIIVMSKG
ncbi:MAG TPA: hypothetical protein VIM70_09910 [Clostridium sp.]|uniref:hypothetical protein n=1 Tax=Clostridium sp. TaxID=1506 RepID=UPI002F95A214